MWRLHAEPRGMPMARRTERSRPQRAHSLEHSLRLNELHRGVNLSIHC